LSLLKEGETIQWRKEGETIHWRKEGETIQWRKEEGETIHLLSLLVLFSIVLSVLPLFSIVLSLLLRFTASDYTFGIFKLFFK
jgi:hypothetical protein